MKKLILAVAMMMGFAGITFAQNAKPAATDKAASKKEAKKPAAKAAVAAEKPAPATAAKPAAKADKPVAKADKPAAKPAASKDVVLKKDGTPDKRYKNAPKAAGPTKKDGTPDMRYKENKKP